MIHSIPSRIALGLLGLLALVATAEAQRPGSGRPSGGGGGGGGRPSSSSVSRPSSSSMSRPSSASVSRSSGPSVSRPSAASAVRSSSPSSSRTFASPSYQRGSTPSSAPQARPAQPSAPRYEAPSAPRYTAPSQPRYEQPAAPRYAPPSQPRYEAPGSRYEAPSTPSAGAPAGHTTYDGGAGPSSRNGSGRVEPTPYGGSRDDSGRIYDGGRGSTNPDGAVEPARIDRNTPTPYQPRVWQPDSVVDLSGAVRAPRVGVPTLSGSRSGPAAGLASGRLSRAGFDAARPASSVPHPEISADALRARYGAATPDTKGSATAAGRSTGTEAGRGSGLSSGRTRGEALAPTKRSDASAPATTRGEAKGRTAKKPDADPKAGTRSGGKNSRIGATPRRIGDLEKTNPTDAGRVRAGTRAGHAAGTVAGDVVIGTCSTGDYDGNCWDPDNDCWGGYGWYWNSCWTGGWWWSWSFCWPYGSCWWGYPSYYSSCYWPYGYGYSSWGWCVSPYAYTSVVYVESEPEVVAQEQVGEPLAPEGAVPKVAPEIKEGLEKSADEALAAGDTAFREGRYSDAVRHYARAVEFSPERGSLWLILADALFATGDYHYAAYAFRRAIDLDATLLETLVDKHDWYGNPAEFDRHIAWAEAYLRDHVLDEDARLVLAANYLFARRFASASDALESAFGAGLVETTAGRLVLERSRRAMGIVAPK